MAISESASNGADIVRYDNWTPQLDELSASFRSAEPFPHIVLDNFLDPSAAQGCLDAFPELESQKWINYTHVNERKFGQSDRAAMGPAIGSVIDALNEPRFLRFIEQLTGIEGLIADPALMGGGLHQSGPGGYLNIHADFTGHPHQQSWQRRVNLLVYLNQNWLDEYGGKLELWDAKVTHCVKNVAPIFNRAVIFRTDLNSFHGHPDPLACPPGMTRKSIALYYFTEEAKRFTVRSTEYRARPGEGINRVWIYLDKMALRAYDKVKRTFGLSDDFASNLLGKLSRNKKR